MKKTSGVLLVLITICTLSLNAHATLIVTGVDTLGNQLIYDATLGITWYDYTNEQDYWQNQVSWADALAVDFGGTIYDDWRLPVTYDQTCDGYCANSEMGQLYYTEMEKLAGGPLGSTDPFGNLLPNIYWSGTPYSLEGMSWLFRFEDGFQSQDGNASDSTGYRHLGIAVRDGDVRSVPEPNTLALLVTGLVGLIASGRMRQRRRR